MMACSLAAWSALEGTRRPPPCEQATAGRNARAGYERTKRHKASARRGRKATPEGRQGNNGPIAAVHFQEALPGFWRVVADFAAVGRIKDVHGGLWGGTIVNVHAASRVGEEFKPDGKGSGCELVQALLHSRRKLIVCKVCCNMQPLGPESENLDM